LPLPRDWALSGSSPCIQPIIVESSTCLRPTWFWVQTTFIPNFFNSTSWLSVGPFQRPTYVLTGPLVPPRVIWILQPDRNWKKIGTVRRTVLPFYVRACNDVFPISTAKGTRKNNKAAYKSHISPQVSKPKINKVIVLPYPPSSSLPCNNHRHNPDTQYLSYDVCSQLYPRISKAPASLFAFS